MKYFFHPSTLSDLETQLRTGTLLAFDFDGTLAPIVADPAQARIRPRTARLLTAVCRRFKCVVISGRAGTDVSTLLDGIPLWATVGNHGAELSPGESFERRVRDWVEVVSDALHGLSGVSVEDKGLSLSIHYRNAQDPVEVLRRVDAVSRTLSGVRAVGGKLVVNLVPSGSPDKGKALDLLRHRAGCARAMFVGDDVTDEDAFSLPRSEVISVRVGELESSAAMYYLQDQEEIDDLLEFCLGVVEKVDRA